MPGRTNFLNPGRRTETSYVPAGNWGSVKLPVSELPAVYTAPVLTFFASMEAPGITAPVASDTVPVIVPRSVWANAAGTATRQTANNSERALMAFIASSRSVGYYPTIQSLHLI